MTKSERRKVLARIDRRKYAIVFVVAFLLLQALSVAIVGLLIFAGALDGIETTRTPDAVFYLAFLAVMLLGGLPLLVGAPLCWTYLMNRSLDGLPPDQCIRCGYDQSGLPRPRACPECGLADRGNSPA